MDWKIEQFEITFSYKYGERFIDVSLPTQPNINCRVLDVYDDPGSKKLKSEIHKLIDGKVNTVWSDNFSDEESTKIYFIIDELGFLHQLKDIGTIAFYIRERYEIFCIEINDGLL